MSLPVQKNVLKYERSTAFYHPACDLIITSTPPKLVYGVIESDICAESFIIRDMLMRGRMTDPALGKHDDQPLLLPVDQDDLEAILGCRYSETPLCFIVLCTALRASNALSMARTREMAIEKVSADTRFKADPVTRLRLGQLGEVREWFVPAYQELIERPVCALSLTQMNNLGIELLYRLIQSRKMIELVHVFIALNGPYFIRSPRCSWPATDRCHRGWKTFWDVHAVPMLINDTGIRPERILEHLTDDPRDMCALCLVVNIFNVCDKGYFSEGEGLRQVQAEEAYRDLVVGGDEESSDEGPPESDEEDTGTSDSTHEEVNTGGDDYGNIDELEA